MTVLDNIVTGLKTAGYKVNLSPQEKLATKEVVITLDSVDIEKETAVSYFMDSTYAINFVSDTVTDIAVKIPAIILIIEAAAVGTMRDFQAITPTIDRQDGTQYMVAIKFTYREMINIV